MDKCKYSNPHVAGPCGYCQRDEVKERLRLAENLLRRVPHSLSEQMEGLDKEIDSFLANNTGPGVLPV